MKRDRNARINILSNMLINSPVYLVEPSIKSFINILQAKNIKVIAHCSSKGTDFGVIQNFKEWRYNLLKNLGLDFSASFPQSESFALTIKNNTEISALFYKGLLFGGKPKAKALGAFLDHLDYRPSQIIYFDDCETFVEQYAIEMKRRNIPFKGFIYKRAIQQKPQLNSKIVDTQVSYMKKNTYIDDIRASKIIRSKK